MQCAVLQQNPKFSNFFPSRTMPRISLILSISHHSGRDQGKLIIHNSHFLVEKASLININFTASFENEVGEMRLFPWHHNNQLAS